MMIYDLDNEYGGRIIGDDGVDGAVLQVDSNKPAAPAISILSTLSAAPVKVNVLGLGVDIDHAAGSGGPAVDIDSANTSHAGLDVKSGVTIGRAVSFGRTVVSSTTIAPVVFTNPSAASAAIFEVAAGFISCTSVVLTTVANFDYALPISLNGQIRYIPLAGSAAIVGGAKFV